ncbi:thioredoxin [Cytophaga sp. FL35]|uniref:thioredoxin n=1 Tax=Cytophaga sp. FL35 TaxID=1904456 RepID=UPI001653EDD0|nr:thioredoxin [Cytophaga sp. FL35]MBC6996986.1 thioredoxin [Cytophaga sp. FL35]
MSKFSELMNSEKPLLVDFFAEWCGPCKMMPPILKEVKDQLGEDVTIVKIDVDKNQQMAAKYQVRGVPTLILFKNGEIKWRQSGVMDANSLTQIIKSH